MLASSDRHAVKFSLSPGQAHDAPEGRKLLSKMGSRPAKVPPKKSRKNPWKYDKEMYKKRNEVERLFRRLKGYHLSLLSIRQTGCDIYGIHRIPLHLQHAPLASTHPNYAKWFLFYFQSCKPPKLKSSSANVKRLGGKGVEEGRRNVVRSGYFGWRRRGLWVGR